MTQYEREKTENLIRGMSEEELEIVKGVLCEVMTGKHNRKGLKELSTLNYEIMLNVKVSQDFNGFEGLLSDREFAENLAQFIANEISLNGVAQIDIIKSSLNVT